ncbi:ABC-2 type transport system permease protein [Crossiella equi]|uniref:ABC-2 type transport system permease protein n=1 Tax=Crossiella equi TaxID=130796 RepID=A0ABS5A5J9_9PSEU|nr:ABC transporter permease [Crossiella equi]MBP2471875.1 ABC-2 type transport system permease protein [Crossiella equi]
MNVLRVVGNAARAGWADYTAVYTLRSWLLGWLLRVLCQVAFFTSVGRLVGAGASPAYLLVGNAVLIAAMESCMVVASTTWERRAGTLPLLVASGTHPAAVFCGRSVHWVATGTLTSLTSLAVIGLAVEPSLLGRGFLLAVPLVLLVAASTYCFALVLAALVLRFMELRNVIGNLAYLGLMVLCGVQVPVGYWPPVLQHVAAALPLTHGLSAVRAALGEGQVLRPAALEAVVGLCWLGLAVLAFRWLVDGGRRDGSIEFND